MRAPTPTGKIEQDGRSSEESLQREPARRPFAVSGPSPWRRQRRRSWLGDEAGARGRRDHGRPHVVANVLTAACDTIPGMSRRSDARGEDDRRRFVADPDVLGALDLTFGQLSDPDVRSVVIRHEHPEFEQALKEDRRQIEGADGPMNPRLHLKLHEIVATQLWDDSPPEVWDTAVRLLDAGYERHEILHMLARPVSDQIWEALHDERPYDHERHAAALNALPGSWERERTTTTTTTRHDDARKQARRAARAARQRNRRRPS